MCTLAIYFRVFAQWPVVIAANRDEVLSRPTLPPTTLAEHPQIVGGKDLTAGGTWLAINEYGVIGGLLNRRQAVPNNPSLRSRGLLCLEALAHRSVTEALAFVVDQEPESYNPFNLLLASRGQSAVVHNHGGRLRSTVLTPGVHLLTNLDVDDFECPRISRSYDRFAAIGAEPAFSDGPELRRRLHELLADHSTQLDPRSGQPNSLCIHRPGYGTRSSSLIFMNNAGHIEHYFAPGPPCTTDYAPAPVPAQE
jgi:uncharacterized protein with NRDE domain